MNLNSVLRELRLKNLATKVGDKLLNDRGDKLVSALTKNTPKDTGETSISYVKSPIKPSKKGINLEVINVSTTKNGIPVVILVNYGHRTVDGGYVRGRRFIEKSIREVEHESS